MDEINEVSTDATRRAARIQELRENIHMLKGSLEDVIRAYGSKGPEITPTAGEELDDTFQAYASNPDITRARIKKFEEELVQLEEEHKKKMN